MPCLVLIPLPRQPWQALESRTLPLAASLTPCRLVLGVKEGGITFWGTVVVVFVVCRAMYSADYRAILSTWVLLKVRQQRRKNTCVSRRSPKLTNSSCVFI